ncbi:MAG: putative protease HtpX, partial [Pseudomonadota bacterium]
VSFLTGYIFEHYHSYHFHETQISSGQQHALFFGLITFVVICIGSLAKIHKIKSQGMIQLLTLAGAEEVDASTGSSEVKTYLNIIDEMAIASGLPIPVAFIIPNDYSINAFTAGLTPSTACICVTEGALNYLSRSELQGVIAHEYSHILHGDVLFNTKMLGILNGYVMFANVGSKLMEIVNEVSDRGRVKTKLIKAVYVFGFILYLMGYLGVFFASILRAAFNRQREWLADASAVQFTRSQEGIRGALIKIDKNIYKTMKKKSLGESYSHMCFVRAVRGFWALVFASHPPLVKRIRVLGLSDYESPEIREPFDVASPQSGPESGESFNELNDMPMSGLIATRMSFDVSKSGSVSPEALVKARRSVCQIPKALLNFLQSREQAFATLVGIIIFRSTNEPLQLLTKFKERRIESLTFFDFIRDLVFPHLKTLSDSDLHTFVQLICKTLRDQSQEELERQLKFLSVITESDGLITVSELSSVITFAHAVSNKLDIQTFMQHGKGDRLRDISALIAYVARLASESDQAKAEKGYHAATSDLKMHVSFPSMQDAQQMHYLIRGLGHVKALTLTNRMRFVQALLKCVQSDELINERESAALRSLCTSLDCPFPLS